MKRPIGLEGRSKHRTIFMGIAIVCIMLCHNTLVVPQQLQLTRQVLSAMFQCGVDVFMLLSGLGLYYSFRKGQKAGAFWKKRFAKILPSYIIVALGCGIVFVGLLRTLTLQQYIYKYCLITFFLGGELNLWFIAAILLLYIVFPSLYAALEKHPRVFALSGVVIAIGCLALSRLNCPKAISLINEIFVSRLPGFLAGMIIGKTILDGKHITVPTVYAGAA